MLVTNQKSSLYGGVNQQAAEHRAEHQVEECINAYPTINQGLLKRNPTRVLALDSSINYADDMWTFQYDRGLAGNASERYSIQITDTDGLAIVNIDTGKIYKKDNGISFETTAEDYLAPFAGARNYAAVTIKDTTFLVNKSVIPIMDKDSIASGGGSNSLVTRVNSYIFSSPTTRPVPDNGILPEPNLYAPQASNAIEIVSTTFFGGKDKRYIISTGGSTTSIQVDGYNISVSVPPQTSSGTNNLNIVKSDISSKMLGMENYVTQLFESIYNTLPTSLYRVNKIHSSDGGVARPRLIGFEIYRQDGTPTTSTLSLSIPVYTNGDYTILSRFTPVVGDYFDAITTADRTINVPITNAQYLKDAFVWIKSSNPSTGYTYTVTATDTLGNFTTASVSDTTTEGAAQALKTALEAHVGGSKFVIGISGSILKITAVAADMLSIDGSDSFGNQAMTLWAKEMQSANDLPKVLGFDSIVHIVGDNSTSFNGYWLKYELDKVGQWVETIDPTALQKIDTSTMPHILVKNSDDTFTFKEYDKWADRLVGDDKTNEVPSFLVDDHKIKDIFFFKNRLGFITSRTVIMSEVGGYGNFFRTTVSTLLDSDRIDTSVDTTKAIQLEYAAYLEDSLMLFSDKAQFKLEGGKILSPKDIQISQSSAYEVNPNIRPLFMNNKLFFAVVRGESSAIMQYFINGDGRISEAIDITSHVETYIPRDVRTLSGSSINNMLFLTSPTTPDTVYVYKFLDSGNERVQSAWFKWTYNGNIYSAFSLGQNLNILIDRDQDSASTDWVLGDGIYSGDKTWTSDGIFWGSPDSLTSVDNFEVQEIVPQSYLGEFIDAASSNDSDVVDYLEMAANMTHNGITLDPVWIPRSEDIVIQAVGYDELPVGTEFEVYSTDGISETEHLFSTNGSLIIPQSNRLYIRWIGHGALTAGSEPIKVYGFVATGATSGNSLLAYGRFEDGVTGWTNLNVPSINTLKYIPINLGALYPVQVDLGEWVVKSGKDSLINNKTKFKTAQINAEDNSIFELDINNIKRDKSRTLKSKYVVNKRPMIYGNVNDIRLRISDLSENGFRINSVTLEGNFNTRNRRI